jgi:hypothetical protein
VSAQFLVWIEGEPVAGINARSWYDARAFASTRWPTGEVKPNDPQCAYCGSTTPSTIESGGCAASGAGCNMITFPLRAERLYDAPNTLTVQEIAREHIEGVERVAYMRGRKECAQEIVAHMEERIPRYASALSRRVLHSLKEDIRKVFG